MNGRTALAVLAAIMLGGAALAQTSPEGAPAVPPVPPGGEQEAAARKDAAAVLAQLAQDVMVAQQVGYLAADKNVEAGHALLGDRMALVNSQINQRLDQLTRDADIALPRRMDEQAQARFERMKAMNKDQFAQSLVAFVNETYPRILGGIEALSQQMPDDQVIAALSREAAPQLRDQMRTASQLARGEADQQSAEEAGRGPTQRKDDPAVIPDATPGGQR